MRGVALPHVPASSQAEAAFGYGAGFGSRACACDGVCDVCVNPVYVCG